MRRLGDIKISRKLALGFGGCAANLACVVALALWGLAAANAASEKAQRYAHKLEVSVRINATLSEIALRMTTLAITRQVSQADEVLELRKRYTEDLQYLKADSTTAENLELLSHIEGAIVPWRDLNNKIIQDSRDGARIDSVRVSRESLARFGTVKSAITDYLKFRQQRLETFQREQRETAARLRLWLGALALITLLASILISRVISRSVAVPLSQAILFLNQLAEGDLTRDVRQENLKRKDEIGVLAKAVDKMTHVLRDIVGSITREIGVLSRSSSELSANSAAMSEGSGHASEESHTVAAAAEQMSANAVSVAAGMEQTTTNLTGVATATEEMTSTIGEIARNSERARRITEAANRQAASISEQMNHLGAAAQEIGKVTETITEISSQTNLLALNATIEAARAGSAGKGFAVVANEIKELAQQTAAATEDIKSRVAGVQSSTAAGISEIGKISGVIHDVSDIVSSIAAAIEEQSTVTSNIARNIAEASTGVGDANARTSETSQAAASIAKGIARVDEEARRMAEGSEIVRSNASMMCQVSEQLQTLISRFRVSGGDHTAALANAVNAHSAWTLRLKAAIASRHLDVPVATIRADNECQFGKWLYGAELSTKEKQSENYTRARQLHARFHEEASKVAQLALTGQTEAAERAMSASGEYARNSAALVDALTSWQAVV